MKMPRRTKEIELTGDYKGFKCEVLLSFPIQVFSYIQSNNFDLIQGALKKILISWNFNDEDGKPLPQPGEMVPAVGVFDEPLTKEVPILDEKGEDTGETKTVQVMISAISLIPQELAMMIIEKVMNEISGASAP